MDVYFFDSYRKLIEARIDAEIDPGSRGRLAKAARCNPSWITRVLSGAVDFTPDQAYGIAQYFGLNKSEEDYFLLLVEHERAATPALKTRIKDKLGALKTFGKSVGSSVKNEAGLLEDKAPQYYSSWIYAAAHVACMIQSFSTRELCSLLRVDSELLSATLRGLEEMGLVTAQAGKWHATGKSLHLPSRHSMARAGHVCWRNRTIQFLQEGTSDGFHYSGVHHLAKRDVEIIRRKLNGGN
jgi:uncharacterized protein (TIGR02147 family)